MVCEWIPKIHNIALTRHIDLLQVVTSWILESKEDG